MTQTAIYAPAPEPRPRISRDRTAVVLAVVAIGSVLALLLGDWLQGRLNSIGFPFLLGCCLLLVYPVTAFILLGRVLIRFVDGTPTQRIRWLLLLALVGLPVVLVLVFGLPQIAMLFGGYMGGFTRWTQTNVDAKAIRQWSSTVPIDPKPEWDGLRGCVPPGEFRNASKARVPRSAWPQSVLKASPDEVHILGDRSATLLAWPAGHAGYARVVVIMAAENSHPLEPYVDDLGGGVWVIVRGPT